MNYKVLYRKYRPDSFDNLVGQNAIVDILKNSIKNNKIAHAYIFSGPRGTGKTSTARILAKSINCLENTVGFACEKCTNCLNFNNSPDIIEIDAASNNGVDEIRELINNVKIMPTSLKYKVYIIDEVHMLSQSAFNALLLTLEEPPEHVIFILATTNLESVPITILSRCQKFDFKRISQTDIIERLKFICEAERIKYTDEAIKEISSLADGGLRDALSILDQLSKTAEEINLDLVTQEIGTISNEKIDMLITSIDDNDIGKVEDIIKEFREINLNYKVIIKKLIEEISKFAIDNLKNGIKHHLTYDDYKNIIIELNDILNKINVSIDPYILIEILLLNYVDHKEKSDVTDKIEYTEQKEEKITELSKKEIKTQNNKKEVNSIVEIRINNCFVNASKDKLNEFKELWDDFLKKTTSSKMKGLLADTIPVTASDRFAIIMTSIKHKDVELMDNLLEIENILSNYISNYSLVFIDEQKWIEEKQKYIENLKNGYKYEILNDSTDKADTNNNETEIKDLVGDVFNLDKLEIE